ncbi:hypothetical protein ACWY4P_45300 [Streptomyces sp. LZ34]
MVADKREAATERTREAPEAGCLETGTDLTHAPDIGPALLFNRLMVTGEPIDEASAPSSSMACSCRSSCGTPPIP